MPRAAADSDVFNALAESRRRAIFELVCGEELAVGEIADALGFDQPSVSRHLQVLRAVDLVDVRREGRKRLYAADPASLAPLEAWMKKCERLWNRHLDAIQQRAERIAGT